jgi:hypothetical protein
VVLSWVKSAVGTGFTVILTVAGALLPLAFFDMRVTVYVPGVLNKMELFFVVLVAWLTFGGTAPKFQLQEVGVLVEASLNETANGGHPDRGVATIDATGTCEYPVYTAASSRKDKRRSFLING